jgi:hypothetical protein
MCCVWAGRTRAFAGTGEFADVDLAGYGGGDERYTEFLETLNGLADLGGETIEPGRLSVEGSEDGVLFHAAWRWHRQISQLRAVSRR